MADSQITDRKSTRLEGMDALRGLAALAVVFYHYTIQFPNFYAAAQVPFAFEYGFYGVNLFFMISGFVILMSLEKSDGKGFIQSRFVRLFPVYWVAVLFTAAVLIFTDTLEATPTAFQLLVNLTMFEEFVNVTAIDGSYWSLTYELGFYIMMFGIFRTRLKRHTKWVPVWMTVGAASFPFIVQWAPHPLYLMVGVNYFSHLFAVGMALYLIRKDGVTLPLVCVCIAAPLIQAQQDGLAGGIAMAFAVVCMIWATSPSARVPKGSGILLWLGTISYALYLIHQMVGYVVMAKLQQLGITPGVSLLMTVACALSVASALAYLVEKPAMRRLPKLLSKLRIATLTTRSGRTPFAGKP